MKQTLTLIGNSEEHVADMLDQANLLSSILIGSPVWKVTGMTQEYVPGHIFQCAWTRYTWTCARDTGKLDEETIDRSLAYVTSYSCMNVLGPPPHKDGGKDPAIKQLNDKLQDELTTARSELVTVKNELRDFTLKHINLHKEFNKAHRQMSDLLQTHNEMSKLVDMCTQFGYTPGQDFEAFCGWLYENLRWDRGPGVWQES